MDFNSCPLHIQSVLLYHTSRYLILLFLLCSCFFCSYRFHAKLVTFPSLTLSPCLSNPTLHTQILCFPCCSFLLMVLFSQILIFTCLPSILPSYAYYYVHIRSKPERAGNVAYRCRININTYIHTRTYTRTQSLVSNTDSVVTDCRSISVINTWGSRLLGLYIDFMS